MMSTQDTRLKEKAIESAKLLLKSVGGDPRKIPQSWANALEVQYSEASSGDCWLDMLPKLAQNDTVSYSEQDYEELIQRLAEVDVSKLNLPDKESIISVEVEAFSEPSSTEDTIEFDWDFASFAEGEDMSSKMEEFLGKTIATVYTSGLDRVSDAEGNAPSEENNYLLNEAGDEFSGKFYDDDDIFTFKIYKETEEDWGIEYKLDNP